MAFVRAKKHGKRTYYYLVESYREEGRMRQRIIKYLGKEVPEEYRRETRKGESNEKS